MKASIGMDLPTELKKKIIEFLMSLPNVHSERDRRALVSRASLDQELVGEIDFGGTTNQFMPLLVDTLVGYGDLQDGRDALEAVLEAAKDSVGPRRKKYCDQLIQGWRVYRQRKGETTVSPPIAAANGRSVADATDGRNKLRWLWPPSVWWVPIVVALIGLASVLITSGILPISRPDTRFDYQVRVQEKDTGRFIPNAVVTLEVVGQAPLDGITDSNGLARLLVSPSHAGKPGRLIVEAMGYQRYTKNLDLVEVTLPDVVQLERASIATTLPTLSTTVAATSIATPAGTATSIPDPIATVVPTTPPAPATPQIIATDRSDSLIIFADEDSLTIYISANLTSTLQDLNLEYRIDGGEEKYFFAKSDGFASYVDGTVPPPFCLHLERAGSPAPFPLECQSANIPIVRLPNGSVFWWDEFGQSTKTLFVNLGDEQLGICATGFSRCSVEIP